MAIKVVVVDGAQLPAGVDFPPLDAAKYGWEQYPALTEEDIAERCWRADIVVALATPIEQTTLEKMPRLKLLIAAGEACRHLQQDSLQQYGVELLTFPSAQCRESAGAEDLCGRISQAVDQFIRELQDKGRQS